MEVPPVTDKIYYNNNNKDDNKRNQRRKISVYIIIIIKFNNENTFLFKDLKELRRLLKILILKPILY